MAVGRPGAWVLKWWWKQEEIDLEEIREGIREVEAEAERYLGERAGEEAKGEIENSGKLC